MARANSGLMKEKIKNLSKKPDTLKKKAVAKLRKSKAVLQKNKHSIPKEVKEVVKEPVAEDNIEEGLIQTEEEIERRKDFVILRRKIF